jgi:Ca2+-binding EF-hand superfamily protein
MGLSIDYGKKKESFQADEKEVVVIANEMKNFVRECNNKYYSKDMFANIRSMLGNREITFGQFLQACEKLIPERTSLMVY